MKVLQRTDFRVEIWPSQRMLILGDDTDKRTCELIQEQVKRHIDDVEHVEIKCNVRYMCSFCKRDWGTDEQEGYPLCCQAAQEEVAVHSGREV